MKACPEGVLLSKPPSKRLVLADALGTGRPWLKWLSTGLLQTCLSRLLLAKPLFPRLLLLKPLSTELPLVKLPERGLRVEWPCLGLLLIKGLFQRLPLGKMLSTWRMRLPCPNRLMLLLVPLISLSMVQRPSTGWSPVRGPPAGLAMVGTLSSPATLLLGL